MSTETDETTELLIRARGFIQRGWCRAFAQDAAGRAISPIDKRAISWCMGGALVAAGMPWSGRQPALLRLEAVIQGQSIVSFNDRQETVEPVLAAFDRAIAAY